MQSTMHKDLTLVLGKGRKNPSHGKNMNEISPPPNWEKQQ
jgi:hypothetical protein